MAAFNEEMQRIDRQAADQRRRAAEANERVQRQRIAANERAQQRQLLEARLKPGERCLGGRFARQIDGDARRWESDSSQDWKCNRQPRP